MDLGVSSWAEGPKDFADGLGGIAIVNELSSIFEIVPEADFVSGACGTSCTVTAAEVELKLCAAGGIAQTAATSKRLSTPAEMNRISFFTVLPSCVFALIPGLVLLHMQGESHFRIESELILYL
jgi:hypothetical protein